MSKKMTLKQLRAGTNYRQVDVANALGVSLAAYNAWEQFSAEQLKAIAEFYGCSAGDIIVPIPLN